MLCGEVLRREKRVQQLTTELSELRGQVKALDTAMALFEPRLDPGAGGVVHATTVRYGSHGGLTRFLLTQVQEAGPTGVDATQLAIRAASKFGVDIASWQDLRTYQQTVGWALRALKKRRLVEVVLPIRRGPYPLTWRVPSQITLEDMTADYLLQVGHGSA